MHPTMLRVIGLTLALASATLISPQAAAGPAQDMIASLAQSAEPVMNDRALTPNARADKLQALLAGVLDRDQMARSMLGRHWRSASPSQKTELTKLLQNYLVEVYAGRVDAIVGEITFKVDGERELGDRILVESHIFRPNQPALTVNWQVETINGAPMVTDIIVEGVSLIISQRADFSSVIRQNGGIDGLIAQLRQKMGVTNN